jgi:hypothetical protein
MNSNATCRNLWSHLKERAFYSSRGFIDVWLLSENHCKFNIIFLLRIFYQMKVFVDHFLHHLIKRMDPQNALVIGQRWCSSKNILAFILHHYYEWLKWCYFTLNVTYDQLLFTITYSMALLHSLCWWLKDQK